MTPLFVLLYGLFCIEGAVLSWMSLREPHRSSDNPRLHAMLLLPTCLLFAVSLAAYRPMDEVERFASGMVLTPFAVCWLIFICRTGGFYFIDYLPGLWMGDHLLKAKKTYDQAEAAVKRGALDRAALIYAKAIETSPKDPGPRLSLADLWLAKGEREKGKALLREAAGLSPDAHAKAPILFRLSDLARDAGDVTGARSELEAFLAARPPEPYAGHARERLSRLA